MKEKLNRDQLAQVLRGHRAEIVEADEWRPLADHVLELARGGYLQLWQVDPLTKEAAE